MLNQNLEVLKNLRNDTEHVDNLIYFRYIKNPFISIKNPKIIIEIKCLDTNHTYKFGSYIEPSDKEIEDFILYDYLYAMNEYELFKFDKTKFNINKYIKK